MFINEWIKQKVDIGIEYYSAFKKGKKILLHATIWMNHEDIMSNETANHKKSYTVWLQLYETSEIVTLLGRNRKLDSSA